MSKEILKLIENVSPDDTEALRKIDMKVAAYVTPTGCRGMILKPYTTSRDAQEAINELGDVNRLLVSEFEGSCNATFHHTFDAPEFNVRRIVTKKLAELHVRLQAKAHERETTNL